MGINNFPINTVSNSRILLLVCDVWIPPGCKYSTSGSPFLLLQYAAFNINPPKTKTPITSPN